MKKTSVAKATNKPAKHSLRGEVQAALAWLERHGSKKFRQDMVMRYGITTRDKVFGVSMANLQKLARQMGRNHDLAEALWESGWYEGRMLASLVDRPERVTPAQMDRWVRDMDNWAVCDTVCFKLFDQTPHALAKVTQWAGRREQFMRRAAFALLACVALHDKRTGNAPFVRTLPLIEAAASDERNFVKKGVSWALRSIGRRNTELHAAAVTLARRLADSPQAATRWVGKDALRDLTSPAVTRRLAVHAGAPR